jgi:hypothetical protein
MEHVSKYDDPELMDAVLHLVAGVAADKDSDKFKHEAAWAAIDYGFTKTAGLRKAAQDYLGVAV